MNTLLLDGDLICYRSAAAAEKARYRVKHSSGLDVVHDTKKECNEFVKASNLDNLEVEHIREYGPVEHALYLAKETINGIVSTLGGSPEIWLGSSDGSNFRKQVATLLPYKGNRSPFDKPRWLQETRDYLIANWGAQCAEEEEADDRLGIRQTEEHDQGNENIILCSIDKDLLQIPGQHYNWVRKERKEVNERESIRSFYLQLLTGDRTDNIPGIAGVGPVTAEAILAGFTKESGLFGAARKAWHDAYPAGFSLPEKSGMVQGSTADRSVDSVLLEVGRLLWIRRYPEQMWEFPK